jgi:hypothetical protein
MHPHFLSHRFNAGIDTHVINNSGKGEQKGQMKTGTRQVRYRGKADLAAYLSAIRVNSCHSCEKPSLLFSLLAPVKSPSPLSRRSPTKADCCAEVRRSRITPTRRARPSTQDCGLWTQDFNLQSSLVAPCRNGGGRHDWCPRAQPPSSKPHNRVGALEFGTWNFPGAWNLGFGIFKRLAFSPNSGRV